jgi:hypothetical protein
LSFEFLVLSSAAGATGARRPEQFQLTTQHS